MENVENLSYEEAINNLDEDKITVSKCLKKKL